MNSMDKVVDRMLHGEGRCKQVVRRPVGEETLRRLSVGARLTLTRLIERHGLRAAWRNDIHQDDRRQLKELEDAALVERAHAASGFCWRVKPLTIALAARAGLCSLE